MTAHNNPASHSGQCACGASSFTVSGPPVLRLICHCTICQEFNDAAFADVSIYTADNVNLPDNQPISFSTFKKPPAVQRGKCQKCGKPAIEFFHLPVMQDLVMIPSENIAKSVELPAPKVHIFYHRRIADINDALPKVSGPIRSQLAMGRCLLPGLMRNKK